MGGRHTGFIERSIMGALSFLKESVFADEVALRRGFLQSLDPRVRAVSILSFILAVLFVKRTAVLFSLYLCALLLAGCSRVGIWFFLKRTWVFIPLFSLFVAIPALFSAFTPGEALVSFRALGQTFAITRPGVEQAALFLMRVVTSVSFAVLLSLTTRHFELLKVLRAFRVPQVFVMTLGMCYRYVFLFVEVVEHTYLGIKSRVGLKMAPDKGRKIVAWNIAYLWVRSYQLHEEVYSAMRSRGYRGEPAVLDEFKVRARDWVWLSCCAALLAGVCIRHYLN